MELVVNVNSINTEPQVGISPRPGTVLSLVLPLLSPKGIVKPHLCRVRGDATERLARGGLTDARLRFLALKWFM